MKRTIYFLVTFILILVGCNDITEDLIEDDSINTPSTRAIGDGKYDLLGYGYDCTFSAFKGSVYGRARIIDLNRFLSGEGRDQKTGDLVKMSPAGNIEESFFHSGGEVIRNWGSNMEEYTTGEHSKVSVSSTINSLGVKLFSADLKSYVNDTSRFSSAYCFYRVDTKKATRRLTMSEVYPNYLKYFVTDEFLNNLKYYTGDQMVQKYGTHVLTDVMLGGIGSALFTAKMTTKSKEQSFKTEADLFIGNITTGTSNAEAQKRFQEFKDVNIAVKTYGGTVAVDQGGIEFDPFTGKLGQVSFNFNNWINSVNQQSEQLIGIGNSTTTICLLSEFVDDPIKKKDIEEAIIRYCEKQNVNMLDKKTLDYEKASISFPGEGTKTMFVTFVSIPDIHVHFINKFSSDTTTPESSSGLYYYWTFYPYGEFYRIGVRDGFTDYVLTKDFATPPNFNENDLSQLWSIEQLREDRYMMKHVATGQYMGQDLLLHPKNPNDPFLWFKITISK